VNYDPHKKRLRRHTTCLGHLLHRPKIGFEAYDRYDRSTGVFSTQREAADALAEAAGAAP
jgi:hypothetical protein